MMRVIVPPAVEPVTMAQAFAELRIDPGADITASPDYAEVAQKLKAARRECENIAGCAFVRQTLRYWPERTAHGWRRLTLPRGPLIGIVAVRYHDTDDTLVTVDPADYYAPAADPAALHFAAGYRLPALHERPDAVQIDYEAGFLPLEGADEDDPQHLASGVPEEVGQAILLTLRLLYQSLDPAMHKRTEEARDALLNRSPVKVWSL